MLRQRFFLPFLFFSSAAIAHPGGIRNSGQQIMIRHPHADVNYYCQYGQSLDTCINIACSYATQYDCRVIAQNDNVYYIETHIASNHRDRQRVVIVSDPVQIVFPIVSLFTSGHSHRETRVYHRSQRSSSHRSHHSRHSHHHSNRR